MPSHPLAPLVRSLEREGLSSALDEANVFVRLAEQVHAMWGCHTSRQLVTESMPLGELAAETNLCLDCVKKLASPSGDATWAQYDNVLRAAKHVRSVARFLENPAKTKVPGKAGILEARTKVEHRAVLVVEQGPATPALRAAAQRILAALKESAQQLSTAEISEEQRAKILEQVRAEMRPRNTPAHVRLEDSAVLVGLWGRYWTSNKVQEVIDTFAISGRREHDQVLLCPRYVVDYIHRNYSKGGTQAPLMLTVPADALSEDEAKTAAALWDTASRGPLADLATAVSTAQMTLAATAAG